MQILSRNLIARRVQSMMRLLFATLLGLFWQTTGYTLEKGLVLYLPFDEAAGKIAHDISGDEVRIWHVARTADEIKMGMEKLNLPVNPKGNLTTSWGKIKQRS